MQVEHFLQETQLNLRSFRNSGHFRIQKIYKQNLVGIRIYIFILHSSWIKLINLDKQSLLFKTYTYNMLRIDADLGHTYRGNNWAYHIKNILDSHGLMNIWHNQFNMTIRLNTIKQRIFYMYYQQWYSSINNSPRLETYSLCKHSFKQRYSGIENILGFPS